MRGADDGGVRRQTGFRLVRLFKQTKIADFQMTLGREQEVVRLDVAVKHVVPMSVMEPLKSLAEPPGGQVYRSAAVLPLPTRQVAAGHVLHGHPADHAAHFSRNASGGQNLNNIRAIEL